MRHVVLLWLALACFAAGGAAAQEQPAPPETGQAPAADVRVDPVTGQRYREERPPAGLRRGTLQVSPELAVGAGAVVALLSAWALVRQVRRRA